MDERFDVVAKAVACGLTWREALRQLAPALGKTAGESGATFDELAKAVAAGVPRREVLRRLVGGVAATLFAFLGVKGAWSQRRTGGDTDCEALCRGQFDPRRSLRPFLTCVAGCVDCVVHRDTICSVSSGGTVICANLQTNPNHCGSCTNNCPAPANGVATCTAGKCGFTCNASYAPCNGGCVNTSSDPANCGGCNKPCTAPANAAATCSGGACGFTCTTTYTPCSGRCCPQPGEVCCSNGKCCPGDNPVCVGACGDSSGKSYCCPSTDPNCEIIGGTDAGAVVVCYATCSSDTDCSDGRLCCNGRCASNARHCPGFGSTCFGAGRVCCGPQVCEAGQICVNSSTGECTGPTRVDLPITSRASVIAN